MKFPQPPQDLIETGKGVKVRQVDLFAHACIECAFREAFSENEAKIYSGVKQLHGLRYRDQKVRKNIYFFDNERLEAYIKEVCKDFRNFLTAYRVKKPFVALCGPSPDANMEIAKGILKVREGTIIYPYMGWDELFQDITGRSLKEMGIPEPLRAYFGSSMFMLAKRYNFVAPFYRRLDTILPREKFVVMTDIRFQNEFSWALSRGAAMFNIKALGSAYSYNEQLLAETPIGTVKATFIVNDSESMKKAVKYILDLFDRAEAIGSLQEW